MLPEKNAVHSIPAEVFQKPGQPFFGAVEIQIVAHSDVQVETSLLRLIGVDFPGMKIEHGRLPLSDYNSPQSPPRNFVR